MIMMMMIMMMMKLNANSKLDVVRYIKVGNRESNVIKHLVSKSFIKVHNQLTMFYKTILCIFIEHQHM